MTTKLFPRAARPRRSAGWFISAACSTRSAPTPRANCPREYRRKSRQEASTDAASVFSGLNTRMWSARVKEGGSDEEMLQWAFERGRKPTEEEIEIWNEFMRKCGWNDDAHADPRAAQDEKAAAGSRRHRDDVPIHRRRRRAQYAAVDAFLGRRRASSSTTRRAYVCAIGVSPTCSAAAAVFAGSRSLSRPRTRPARR